MSNFSSALPAAIVIRRFGSRGIGVARPRTAHPRVGDQGRRRYLSRPVDLELQRTPFHPRFCEDLMTGGGQCVRRRPPALSSGSARSYAAEGPFGSLGLHSRRTRRQSPTVEKNVALLDASAALLGRWRGDITPRSAWCVAAQEQAPPAPSRVVQAGVF
jgi:hypothetical protein